MTPADLPAGLRTVGIASTVADAGVAAYRGQPLTAGFLLVMAALATKITGIGLAGSFGVRLLGGL